mmetsp:Transcript_22921/g.57482  ORF Transcript_22921/g.57482 Transcript_22921/m.57482 type:complete len:301 (-) Transcript_22921:14-916(-)
MISSPTPYSVAMAAVWVIAMAPPSLPWREARSCRLPARPEELQHCLRGRDVPFLQVLRDAAAALRVVPEAGPTCELHMRGPRERDVACHEPARAHLARALVQLQPQQLAALVAQQPLQPGLQVGDVALKGVETGEGEGGVGEHAVVGVQVRVDLAAPQVPVFREVLLHPLPQALRGDGRPRVLPRSQRIALGAAEQVDHRSQPRHHALHQRAGGSVRGRGGLGLAARGQGAAPCAGMAPHGLPSQLCTSKARLRNGRLHPFEMARLCDVFRRPATRGGGEGDDPARCFEHTCVLFNRHPT